MQNHGSVVKRLSNFDWFTNLFPRHGALLILSSHLRHSLRLPPRFSEDTAYPLLSRLRSCCLLPPPPFPRRSVLRQLLIHILCSPVLFIAFASASSQFQPAPSYLTSGLQREEEAAGFLQFLLNVAPARGAEMARGGK